MPTGPVDGMTLPVDFKLDAPGMLPQALSGNGEVKLSGTTITINSLTRNARHRALQRLCLDRGNDQAAGQGQSRFQATRHRCAGRRQFESVAQPQGWSEEPIKLDGLNYVDADFQISAAALNVGTLKLAPAKIEGSLASGILRMTLSELGLYDGTGRGRSCARCIDRRARSTRCAPTCAAFARCRC